MCVRRQEVYDLVKGQVQGDELYVEGLDDAFLDWRAQHGEEWARYYGLRVPPLVPFDRSCPERCARPDVAHAMPPMPRCPSTRPTGCSPAHQEKQGASLIRSGCLEPLSCR